jgi:hypothetical protein
LTDVLKVLAASIIALMIEASIDATSQERATLTLAAPKI